MNLFALESPPSLLSYDIHGLKKTSLLLILVF